MRLRSVEQRRLLGFDIENRPLSYWYDGATTSEITAIGWKWTDEPDVHTLMLLPDGRYSAPGAKPLLPWQAFGLFRRQLSEAGLVFGHNVRNHDLRLVHTALVRLEQPGLPPILTTDTLKDGPRTKDMSRSLASLASLYGLAGEKHAMSQPQWENANRLTRDGIEEARVRVVSDVVLQERLRDHMASIGALSEPKMWRP